MFVEVEGFRQTQPQISGFEILVIRTPKVDFGQFRQSGDFQVLSYEAGFKVRQKAEISYFSIYKNVGPVEISVRLRFMGKNLEIST